MKRLLLAVALACAALPAFADEPPAPQTFTLTPGQAQDYANRLNAEIQQAIAVINADQAALKALQDQAPKPKE